MDILVSVSFFLPMRNKLNKIQDLGSLHFTMWYQRSSLPIISAKVNLLSYEGSFSDFFFLQSVYMSDSPCQESVVHVAVFEVASKACSLDSTHLRIRHITMGSLSQASDLRPLWHFNKQSIRHLSPYISWATGWVMTIFCTTVLIVWCDEPH